MNDSLNNNALRKLYILYFFFLPFGSFINHPQDGIWNLFRNMSTIIMLVGMFVIFIKNIRISMNISLINFIRVYLFMVIYSVIASCILATTIIGYKFQIIPMLALYLEVILSVLFNYYCLSNIIHFSQLYKIIKYQVVVSILFGGLQALALFGNSLAIRIYMNLSDVLFLFPLQELIIMERGVTIFSSEPSALTVYCLITIPYLISCLFYSKSKIWPLLALILYAIIFYFSLSTQVLICFTISITIPLILFISKKFTRSILLGAFILGFLSMYDAYISESKNIEERYGNNDIGYAIFDKYKSRDNRSTMMRASTCINDYFVFIDHVGMGVGDGNQGYWYKKNLPSWCLPSLEVQDIINSGTIPNGGGSFFMSYISAYGILGIIVLLLFLIQYHKDYLDSFLQQDRQASIIYLTAITIFLIAGWYTMSVKQNETLVFILTLALIKHEDIKNH